MSVFRDPSALLRHASRAGDLRLRELADARLTGPPPRLIAERAFATLVGRLALEDAPDERTTSR